MRKMTSHTSLGLKRFMHYFLFELFPPVALIAKLASTGLEQMFCLGCMRIMAERTLPVFQRSVNTGLVKPEFLFAMTGIADLVPNIFKNELGNDAVADMTTLAFLIFDDRMYVFH